MSRVLICCLAFVLVGCEQAQQVVDGAARRSAKAAVEEALTTRFPGVPKAAVTPFSDCVIDNSSAREIGEFAKDAVVGVSDTTVTLVQGVLSRSETQTCIAKAGLAALGA